MLSGGEGAEIIQHTHCCDSPSELTDIYISVFFSHFLLLHFALFKMLDVAEFCEDLRGAADALK